MSKKFKTRICQVFKHFKYILLENLSVHNFFRLNIFELYLIPPDFFNILKKILFIVNNKKIKKNSVVILT